MGGGGGGGRLNTDVYKSVPSPVSEGRRERGPDFSQVSAKACWLQASPGSDQRLEVELMGSQNS